MNKLDYYLRPVEKFDANNPEHRRHYYNYLKTNSWGRCPVRFVFLDDHSDNYIAVIERLMLQYYSQQEFGKIKK